MLDALVIDDELPYNVADLASKFNKKKFFDKEFYPISLFYLGMTTLKDKFVTTLPNMTMRSVYRSSYAARFMARVTLRENSSARSAYIRHIITPTCGTRYMVL